MFTERSNITADRLNEEGVDFGPFYLSNSSQRNYIISCLDDCSRKVASRWSERKRSVDVLNVLEYWIIINDKPEKQIPNSYPQLQGKVEAYNKIVKDEFLMLEDIPNIDEGKQRYDIFVKAYNETREHGGINGLTPSEMFLQRLITSSTYIGTKAAKCNPCR